MKRCKHCSYSMGDWAIVCSRCGGGINARTRSEQKEDEIAGEELSAGGVFVVLFIVFMLFVLFAGIN